MAGSGKREEEDDGDDSKNEEESILAAGCSPQGRKKSQAFWCTTTALMTIPLMWLGEGGLECY